MTTEPRPTGPMPAADPADQIALLIQEIQEHGSAIGQAITEYTAAGGRGKPVINANLPAIQTGLARIVHYLTSRYVALTGQTPPPRRPE